MTDKQESRIDNANGQAAESPVDHSWSPDTADRGFAVATMRQCAKLSLATTPDETHRKIIGTLNDQARAAIEAETRVNMSNGFMMLDEADQSAVRLAVRDYDQWTIANAFDADRDFGILFKLANGAWTQATPNSEEIVQIIVWTIDCLDHSLKRLSTRPWDPSATVRVITLMLATEY
jgi:Protein of unknown function (DUF3768)